MPEASFVYPKGGKFDKTINILDQLDVTYTSQWSSLNLTLFCLQSATSNDYFYYNANDNPILANGTYLIPSIDSLDFPITQYPVICHFKLTEYKNNTNGVNGGGFNLTSTAGAAKTFQQTQTSSGTTYSTQTATRTGTGVSTTSLSGSQTLASATASATSVAASGLSSGAAAGIGVGVSLGVILFAAAVAYLFLSKRKRQRNAAVSQPLVSNDYNQPETSVKHEYYKSELPGGPVVTAPIYEPDSRPVERQELMAHERPQYPTSDGRPTAEMP